MDAVIAMGVFTLVGVGGGIALHRWAEPLAEFSAEMAGTALSERATRTVYTARTVRWAARGFILFGMISAGLFAWQLTVLLTSAPAQVG
jgi:hypothetical protein